LKNSIIIAISILALVASFLVFTDTSYLSKGYATLKGGAGAFAGPTLSFISRPAKLAAYVYYGYIGLVGVKKENIQMKKRLEDLELDNQRIPELESENKRLKTILNITEQRRNTMIAARVIGEDVKNWFKCIIIDKGNDHGIKWKMPVVTSKGLVGQTVEVDKWHSKVMVLNDTNSSVDVFVEGKNTRGILEGTGQNTLKLKYILKNDEVEIGDKLVTSGKDGIYSKGIPTGIVITVNRTKPGIFTDVDVMPYNNFRRLDEVLVVKKQ
jgi:rod shape-determining protein MreC